LRLFIAAEIDEKNKKIIHALQEKYKRSSVRGYFTRMENYHITLRFLGETGADLVPEIIFAMERTAEESAQFNFSTEKCGYFSRREGIILYLGIDKGSENLWKISSVLDEELLKSGFPKEKELFTPHITLGRKICLRKDFHLISEDIVMPEIKVFCNSIALMESTREKGLLCYKSVKSVKLQL
jgi:2'-5' RNA ligase